MEATARYPIVKNRTVKSFLIENLSFLALLLALSTYGCAGPSTYRMYPGEDRPKTEIAIIEGSCGHIAFLCCASIIDVDWQGLSPRYDSVAVLPGFHTVRAEVKCVSGGSAMRPNIVFNVQAGHEYQIKTHSLKLAPDLFVVDKNSGEVVPAEEEGSVIQSF